MNTKLDRRLSRLAGLLPSNLFDGNKIGLEKESLRVNQEGKIAQTAHPEKLGSALTHPYITTDYSEALIELITPPMGSAAQALDFLNDTHKFVCDNLTDEILWATSMPCIVAGGASIPIAQYGHSNVGMMKTVYRRGLGHRYGRVMQVIAGVHFNFSLADTFWPQYQEIEQNNQDLQTFINESYFALIRNLQRFGWLVPYLFGASPAVCKSFLQNSQTTLAEFDESTYFEPYATSLRMGDIGYQNNKENESGIKACYDDLDSYIKTLSCAIETPYSEYEKIGIVEQGEYKQLNANILQIENEYYSTIRPKQILNGNEKPVRALAQRGVKYVELRSLDVNAYDPLGMDEPQLLFLEAFLIFCMLQDSPVIEISERATIDHNEMITAHRGRMPGLKLMSHSKSISLKHWAQELMTQMEGVCELLDNCKNTRAYTQSLQQQKERVIDPDRTPSARMLDDMRQDKESFHRFAERMSKHHFHYFKQQHLSADREQFFVNQVDKSHQKQAVIETSDRLSFADFLGNYFAQ